MAEFRPDDHGKSTLWRALRRLLRWTGWSFTILLLCLLLGLLYVTWVGIPVDASFLRAPVAQSFGESIGRAVRIEGAMEMRISAKPRLRIGGLHIANPPQFGGGDFASLGEAHLAIDLWPLLFHRQLRIEELAGSNVQVRLQVKADGSNNWTLHRPTPRPAPARAAAPAPAMTANQALTLLDIESVSLEKLNVEYVSANPTGPMHVAHCRGPLFGVQALLHGGPDQDP